MQLITLIAQQHLLRNNKYVLLSAMDFHENLNNIGIKEGLKGRKLHKAIESFTWNITILKVLFTTPSEY